MFITRRAGNFIKQFSGPGDNTIVCFKFWQAVVASGCPGECSYCFLQTQHPYRMGLYDVKGTLFENLMDLEKETRRWLKHPTPIALIVGENQDGLAFEKPYKQKLGVTPLEILIPLFEKENPVGHTLIVLSKFTSTEYAEVFGVPKNVIFSWSLSLPTISSEYEKKVAPLSSRLKKAIELKTRGYRIRFRLDALAPIPAWQSELDNVLIEINKIQPEMLTIGALRATNTSLLKRAAENNGRNPHIFNYITTIDPSKFKYRINEEFHISVFKQIKKALLPNILLGLCKEDSSIWISTGIEWTGCHCLHGDSDLITNQKTQILHQINSKATYLAAPGQKK